MIKSFVQENYPQLQADYVKQKKMQGLGHAIYTASSTFDDEEIFIILGDTIFDVNLKDVFKNKISSLGVKEVDDPRRFGVAVIENGKIKKLIEKPQSPVSNHALVGLYYISNAASLLKSLKSLIKNDIRTKGEYQLTDALQIMIQQGEEMTAFNVDGWYDCGKPETLLATNKFLLNKKSYYKNYKNVVINKPVFIDNSAEIENSVIGPYATIAAGAKICDSIIRNSIVGENSKICKMLLENSIMGNNSIINGSFKKLNSGDSSEIDLY